MAAQISEGNTGSADMAVEMAAISYLIPVPLSCVSKNGPSRNTQGKQPFPLPEARQDGDAP